MPGHSARTERGIRGTDGGYHPEQTGRTAQRLEIHYTPKHGSRLNIAETELSALTRQCPGRRIPDIETLCNETKTW